MTKKELEERYNNLRDFIIENHGVETLAEIEGTIEYENYDYAPISVLDIV